MTSPVSPARQRSLFCQCNKAVCECWPSTSAAASAPMARSHSRVPSQPSVIPVATQQAHYSPAQQLPTPHTTATSYGSPSTGSHHSPNMAVSPSLTVPGHPSPSSSASRSPQMNPLQLHPLLKAQSILRTPDSPSALRLQWDVRDSANESVIISSHEPEYLFSHPMSAAYATTPPSPFLLIACNEGSLPWLVPVHAQKGSAGVTVRDVLEAIYDVWHTSVEKNMLDLLPTDDARDRVYQAYKGRIERTRAYQQGLMAVDWLGEKTLFVCLERDEALARKRVKEEAMWPYVFALKLKMRRGALVSDA